MFKIAIDGPAGAGKSTISKIVAKKLGFEYIDTGAMYRAVTLKAINLGIDLEDESAYSFLQETKLDFSNGKVLLDDVDVTKSIRSVLVTSNASTPAKLGVVRDFLVNYQRIISNAKNVVMDGRDIGTIVLPNADLKIYLDASVECRATRRKIERDEQGIKLSLEETIDEINQRDFKDSNRKIGPLKKAEDAVLIDSSNLSIEEVVNKIILLVIERGFKSMSTKFFEGQYVSGHIVNVTSGAIYLEVENEEGVVKAVIYPNDIDGYQESNKLYNEYHEGQEFRAQVKKVSKDNNTKELLLILSTKLEKEKEKFLIFDEIKEKDEIIKAEVKRVTSAGADLIYKGVKLFMPAKEIDASIDASRKLVGEKIDVIILFVNPDQFRVVVSNRIAIKKQHRLAKEAEYENISVDDVLDCEVVALLPYGAILKHGEVTGLLHQSEVDHKRIRKIEDHLKEGDNVKAKIIKIEDGKVSFSIKALTVHPWEILTSEYHVDDVFEGEVKKIIPAGAIIKMTDEYSGLMPKSEYSWLISERFDENVHEGDKITVKIINMDGSKKRISLSHKATIENTWGNVSVRKGDKITVKIAEIKERGALVEYKNVLGFLPIQEVTGTKRIGRVDEMYEVGTEIDAIVMEFEPLRAKLTVSSKQLELKKERESFDKYFKEQADETPISTLGDAFKNLGLFVDDTKKED